MNQKWNYCFLLLFSLFIFNCGQKQPKNQATSVAPIAVNAAVVNRGNIEIFKSFGGDVEGIKQSDVYAYIPEIVTGMNVKLGQKIKKGQVLVNLDPGGPNSQYYQTKAAYENARKDAERMQYLLEEKAISQQNYDQASTGMKVAKANFLAASSLVELKSPIDGVVTSILVTIGQPAIPGKPLITVARTDSVRIRLRVGETDAGKILPGSKAEIRVADEGTAIEGKVMRVSESADPGTRGFEVEIAARNEDGRLKPGTFVRISLVLEQYENVLLVPSQAVFIHQGKKSVFAVVGGRAKLLEIGTGGESQDMTYLESGLSEGDKVVTLGKNLVVDDDSLNIVDGL